MQDFDIAVVGAGPSGASAAISLAQFGYRVVLFDRALFPRDKLCGDFVNPINWQVFQDLNVSQDILARPHAQVSEFRLTAADGAEVTSSLPSQGRRSMGLGLRRYYLDHVLVERAKKSGVTVEEGGKVNGVDRDRKGWFVKFDRSGDVARLRAKIIVGADGRNSWVARQFGIATGGRKGRGAVGFEMQLKNIRGIDGSVEIHQFPGGYAGLVRVHADTVNLCFTIEQSRLRETVSFDTLRERFLNRNPLLRDVLSGGEACTDLRSVSPVYFPPRKCYGDGFVLVGDAARVTEPVTGEGIYLALRSGQLAAESIDAALRHNDMTGASLSRYDRACREEFRRRFRLNHLIRILARHPSLLSYLIRASSKRQRLLNSLVKAVCVLSPRAEAHETRNLQ